MKTSYKIYDVIVVGAGPSGSAAAGALSSAGFSVLLLDRKSFPREKVCGDGLTGDSIRMLEHFDIWEEIKSKAFKSDKVELFPFENRSFELKVPVYTIKRGIIDNIIKERAVRSGADFKVANFTGSVYENNDIKEIEVWDYELEEYRVFKGRIIIYAMGCQPGAFVSRYFFKDINIKPEIIAIRGYCHADWDIDHPMIFFDKKFIEGYAWIFPMGNGVYNVGCGSKIGIKDIKKELYEYLKRNKLTSESNINWISAPKGAFLKTNLRNIQHAVKDRILLTGETLGSTYPFTGEGIGKALETGFLTARLVSRALYENNTDILNEYPDFLKKELDRAYRPYRAAENFFAGKYLGKFIYKALCRSKTLSGYVSDILSENKRPEEICFIKFIYKLLKPFIKY